MSQTFSLFKNKNNIEEGLSDDFITILEKSNNPHIICVYGIARIGKSTKLNQIIHGVKSNNYFKLTGPFETKLEIHTTQTKGCDFYGPIKVKDLIERNDIDLNEIESLDKNMLNDDLFFVDTEGLKSIDKGTKTCIVGILTLLQIASIKILYMSNLENETFDEAAKNSKLSNILNIFNNENETIALLRDVPLNDCNNIKQIREEIEEQKDIIQNKINEYFEKIKTKKALCEILPIYELSRKNIDDYDEAYKEQMQSLINTFLSKMKHNVNINGKKLIEIIKELIDIFKQVDDIESMRNTNNALNKILKTTFKQKVKKIYLEIKGKIKQYEPTILRLKDKNEDIKKYLITCIQKELKDFWNIYTDLLKNEVDNIIENYQYKINNDIILISEEIKEKINKEINEITNISKNEEINDYFSKFNFYEEINENDINCLKEKIINTFLEKYKKEFECLDEQYKKEKINYLKNNLEQNIKYKMSSIEKREVYLINIFEKIKKEVSNPFINNLINKDKVEIEKNLDLNILKKEIELFLASHNIKSYEKEDFKQKLNELFEDVHKILIERINFIDLEEYKKKKLYDKTIENSLYIIKPINYQNKVIQIDNNNLVIWDNNNENKQKFKIEYDPINKCYLIQNIENKLFLTYNNSSIYLTEKNNEKNQQWHIPIGDDNNYEIISEINKYLITIDEENINNGAIISCKEKTGKSNQKFYFEATSETPIIIQEVHHEHENVSYFPIPDFHSPYNDRNSIVDALKSINVDSSKVYRRKIGDRNMISGIPFSCSYNIHMLNLLKEGKLIIPSI